MNYTKEIFVKDYFEIHDFYSKIYGKDRTIILMQVGAFHECYSCDTEGLDLISLASNLNIVCTKKNNKEVLSKNNPRMLGFPIEVTQVFIDKLCNLNFTVVVIDQTSEPPKPKREVTGIFSPSTFINTNFNQNIKGRNIISFVIEKTTNKICIGLSSYDIFTGYGSYYETYSNINDIIIALDDSIRYLETTNPIEVLIYTTIKDDEQIQNMTIKNIIEYLGFSEKMLFNINFKNTNKISYQQIIFEKIFKNQPNIFEITNLHQYNWARLSLTNLFEYVKNHQENLINSLKLPKQFINDKFLYLGNRALEQLDIFSNQKSLFDIINYTKTLIGKRYLKSELTKPLIDINKISERYELIDKLIKNDNYKILNNLLEDINDLEKLIRRLEINILHPYELNLLFLSYYQIKKIIDFSNNNNIFKLKNINIDSFLDSIKNTFDLNIISNLNFSNFNDYDKNIFINDKYPEITQLYNKIKNSNCFMEKLMESLSNLIDDKKVKDGSLINLKYNERDGHYLLLTNKRCSLLKSKLEKIKIIKIDDIELDVNELIFTPQPTNLYTKINCKKIKELSTMVVSYKIELAKLTKYNFIQELEIITKNFSLILHYWSKKISFIDFINSGANCAIKNHYSKPQITNNDISYFKAEQLRHPIVENINNNFEYKPHNIELGNVDICGILLYGINSSGKSTLMKSIGLNIILAQIGYYTSSISFEFTPYKSLFTRISGNDNLHRGLSSFMVEMIELTSILKRNDKNTMVIGDEICKGTEEKSANIIVAYMLKTLSESNTSFITATHLHKLSELEIVKSLKNVKSKHLKITYDSQNDKLIFDRELSDGQGDTFYGLTVAKFLMKDQHFNEITSEILNDYNNVNTIKKSKYNSNNYLINCEICKDTNNLETHHINFQKDFNTDKINKDLFHIQKDANYNLVTLCTHCHDDVDRNNYIIYGWVNTTNGRELKYEKQNIIIKKTKYSNDLIQYIKSIHKQTTDLKFARILIKENYNTKVSKSTISKIWSN
jgi:DNA mismatch repair protein MutS